MRFRKRQPGNQGEMKVRQLRYAVAAVMDHYGPMGGPIVDSTVSLTLKQWGEDYEFRTG